jgi:hypothetical protein
VGVALAENSSVQVVAGVLWRACGLVRNSGCVTDSVLRPAPNGAGLPELLSALDSYRLARQTLLGTLGLGQSNRDPLAEFAEHLVAALWQGRLAESRVQANYDLISADGEYVQVKYLANPLSNWPNEHTVRSILGVGWYALVVYEAFAVTGVLAFPPDLTEICSARSAITQTPIDNSACASGFHPYRR